MTRDDPTDTPDDPPSKRDINPFDPEQRRQPAFGRFDEERSEDTYEEPDRDTDYESGYQQDGFDEDGYDAPPFYKQEDNGGEEQHAGNGTAPFASEPLKGGPESDSARDASAASAIAGVGGLPEEELGLHQGAITQSWPKSLIAVAVVALLLVGAGGYGVMQQRSATQKELRDLRAALATAASPDDISDSRSALQEVKRQNGELATNALILTRENQRLVDTVAGLEAQLRSQQSAALQKKVATPKALPAKTPKPAPAPPASKPVARGTWFVNFGSYGQRATAESWIAKLKPTSGRVIVSSATRDGNTFYRVRVIDLADREAADRIARSLESQYKLSKLWVGKQ